jgi:hypothetical protein
VVIRCLYSLNTSYLIAFICARDTGGGVFLSDPYGDKLLQNILQISVKGV